MPCRQASFSPRRIVIETQGFVVSPGAHDSKAVIGWTTLADDHACGRSRLAAPFSVFAVIVTGSRHPMYSP